MERHGQRPLPLGEHTVLITDVETGDQVLRRGRRSRPVQREAGSVFNRWKVGFDEVFYKTAEMWRERVAVEIAESVGQNVERGPSVDEALTEQRVKGTFRSARQMGINSLSVATVIKERVDQSKRKLGDQRVWVDQFGEWLIAQLSEEYHLSSSSKQAITDFFHHPKLPGF